MHMDPSKRDLRIFSLIWSAIFFVIGVYPFFSILLSSEEAISFNVRGEPIVCDPGESYRRFMRTEMDVLV